MATKELKAVNEVAKLKLNAESGKWEVIVATKEGDKIVIRSKSPELAISYFNGKHRPKLEAAGVSILEVMKEDGSIDKTVALGAKQPRSKKAAVKKAAKGSEAEGADDKSRTRKVAERKPFPAFPIKIYGMQHLAGSVKEGMVVSRTSGNYNVEIEGQHGKMVQSFNANTGILKGHNPFHGWQINTAEVVKLHAAAKQKTA